MKTKKIFIQTIAMILCVITLSLSVGSKLCVYNNISKAHAADPFTITMGSLALEEIIMGIAIAVLGADVAYQYRDEILDAYKEFSKNGNNLYAGQNLFEVYSNGERSVRTWDEYEEILKGMGSTASEAFDDYKEKFNNVYVRPAKEYLQYVADFYTDLFTGSPVVGDATYIDGLAEYLKQEYFDSSIIDSMVSGDSYLIKSYVSDYWQCPSCKSNTIATYQLELNATGIYAYYKWGTDSYGKSYYSLYTWKNGSHYIDTSISTTQIFPCCGYTRKTNGYTLNGFSATLNIPYFTSIDAMDLFLKTGSGYENALNYKTALDAIAVTGDDIPTVGNWEELWERLKNPDLPWWFCDPDALGLSNASDLPWFDVAGLHDWANDIPGIKDGIIDTNPDIPWTDVWDKVIDVPDVVIPAIDFPYVDVDDPAKPKPTVEPTVKPTTEPLPTTKPGEIDSSQPVVDLSKFFPFCIPFDLIHLVQALDADPVAPKWSLKLEPPQFPVEWEVTLDLSQFESLAKIFRTGETLLFVVGLILITRGIIKG